MALGHCRHRIHSLGWSIVMFFLIYWACIDEPWVSLVTRVQSAIKKRSNLLKNVSFTQAGCISEQQRTTSINNEYTSSLADGQYMLCPCPPLPSSSCRLHQGSLTDRDDRTSQERAQTTCFTHCLLILVWIENTHRKRPWWALHRLHRLPQIPERDPDTEEEKWRWWTWLLGHTSGTLRCYVKKSMSSRILWWLHWICPPWSVRHPSLSADSGYLLNLSQVPLFFFLGTTISLVQLWAYWLRPAFRRNLKTDKDSSCLGNCVGRDTYVHSFI